MTSSARVDWETPAQLYAFLDREFHFTLDVAATIESAPLAAAGEIFTVDGDADQMFKKDQEF